MRIQFKTMAVFLAPLVLAIVAAYVQWGLFGLPVIPPEAQPPAAGAPQGFPGCERLIMSISSF